MTNTLHSLKTLLSSAEEPLGQEEPEGKNSPKTVAPTPALHHPEVCDPSRERIAEEEVWEHRHMASRNQSKDRSTYIAGNITNSAAL